MRRRSAACLAVLALFAGTATASQVWAQQEPAASGAADQGVVSEQGGLVTDQVPSSHVAPTSSAPQFAPGGALTPLLVEQPLGAGYAGDAAADIDLRFPGQGSAAASGAAISRGGQTARTDDDGDDEPGADEDTSGTTEPNPLTDMPHPPLPPDGEVLPPPAPELTEAEQADREAGVLGTEVQDTTGELEVLPGQEQAPDPDAEWVIEVQVEVESGLPINAEAFGDFVMQTLNDERGWPAAEPVSFARTDSSPEFRVVLASPDHTDELCAPLDTAGQYSCARDGHAALNAQRWAEGAEPFLDGGGDLQDYRRYLVNHEVGHLLGYSHEACPGNGQPAPVMLQQSMGLDGCEPTAWVEE